jgi:hypothetical protein
MRLIMSIRDRITSRAWLGSSRRSDVGRRARTRYRPQLELIEGRILLSTVTWTNTGGGDWDVGANWSTGTVPGGSDDVSIPQSGITVTHKMGVNDAVHSLSCQAALNMSEGSLTIGNESTINNTFNLSTGTLTLDGNLDVSGLFTWSFSTINGNGAKMTAGGVDITGNTNGQVALDNVTLENTGTGTWTGTASFVFAEGAVFNNDVNASFTVQSDKPIFNDGGAAGTINNAGTFAKNTTTGTTTVTGVAFNNTGKVIVSSGTLALDAGGTSSGSFDATGAALDFGGGVSLSSAASVTGSNISFSSGGTNTVACPLTSTSNLSFANGAGTTTFTGSVNTSSATVTLIGGTDDFDTTLSAPTIDVNGGTLGGTAAVSVSSALNWTGGTINDTSTVTVPKGATLDIGLNPTDPQEFLDHTTLDNAGTATWSGADALFMADGAVLNNEAGASFTVQTDLSISLQGSAPCAIDNAGTFTKNTTTGTTEILQIAFNNNGGTVNAQTGTIYLGGGGTDTGGTLDASKGATIDLAGSSTVTMTGTYSGSGAGTVVLKNGTLNLGTGGATFNLQGSLFQWSGGTFNLGANTLTIGSKGTINISGTSPQTFFGTGSIVNQGTINHTGSGALTITQPLNNTGTVANRNATATISGAVTQISSGTLTGGRWEVFGSAKNHSTLTITTAGSAITTIGGKASVELSGLNSSFTNISGLTTDQGSFSILAGQTFTTTGNFTDSGKLTLGAGSTLAVSGSFSETSAGTVTIQVGGSVTNPTIGEITTGATGKVTLAGALMVTSSSVIPAVGAVFTILNNQGSSAVSGTFAGLPERATFMVTVKGTVMTFRISYVGGTGNDVTLTRIS